jgi:hypothetical protein
LFCKAKEEVYSFQYWFRKKYRLAPTDQRFLDMTMEDIKKEFFLDQLADNPEFKLEDFSRDTTADEEWIKQQERENTNEVLKDVFDGKFKPVEVRKEDKVRPTGMSPIEATRNKVKVQTKSKFVEKFIPLGGSDGEFEEVYRETNTP